MLTISIVFLILSEVAYIKGSKHNLHHRGQKSHINTGITKKGSVHRGAAASSSKNSHTLLNTVNGGNSTRRSLRDTLNKANISIENHVHSYTRKSNIKTEANSTRRDIWDALKGANISVQNSVHSVTVRRSHDRSTKGTQKSAKEGANITRKSYVHDAPIEQNITKKFVLPEKDVQGDRRDEEPNEVAVQGKSPFDVADESSETNLVEKW